MRLICRISPDDSPCCNPYFGPSGHDVNEKWIHLMQSRTIRPVGLFIGGEWVDATRRDSIAVFDPLTGQEAGRVASATTTDVDAAIRSAADAWRTWRHSDPHERARIIVRAAQLLRERATEIATDITVENGKLFGDSVGEVEYTAEIMESMAADAPRRFGKILPRGLGEGRMSVIQEPVGPVAAFTPWNYPLTVPGRKVAAALAAGCTVVLKPSEETPASAAALARAYDDAGLPPGVLSVLFGDPEMISTKLIEAPSIRKISFTGSTEVGKLLAARAGAQAKPIMLELGGHAPVLIFDDVDVREVARQARGAKIHNSGQSCGSPVRFLVQESVYEEFIAAFASELASVRVGDGFDDRAEMGPLSNARRGEAVEEIVGDAVGRGARLVAGQANRRSGDLLWAPALLADVPADARIMVDEPFGPIAAVVSFRDEEEAVARANEVAYGLGAYVFTNSAARAVRLPMRLDVGMVSVNRFGVGARDTYFGGRKQSGYGSEGGPEAVEEYMVSKLISDAD